MAAIAAPLLFSEAVCYACYGPITESQMLTLALERRWLLSLDAAADVSPQGLITYATCYACYTGSMFELFELALLDKISQLS